LVNKWCTLIRETNGMNNFKMTVSLQFNYTSHYFHVTLTYFFSPGATTPHWGLYFTALQWALASSLTRFLDHIQRRATFDRTPLNE